MLFDVIVHIGEDTERGRIVRDLAARQSLSPEEIVDRIIDEGVKTLTREQQPSETPTMQLVRKWLDDDASLGQTGGLEAEHDLREFKREMNEPRKQAGARLLYPEAE